MRRLFKIYQRESDALSLGNISFQGNAWRVPGAIRLAEEDEWEILPDRLYYLVKNGTLLSFFRISSRKKPLEYGFHIAGAHHDAAGFRVKPAVSTVDDGYERLTLEPYGGLIQHVWLDRPLACAGRIYYDNGRENGRADF